MELPGVEYGTYIPQVGDTVRVLLNGKLRRAVFDSLGMPGRVLVRELEGDTESFWTEADELRPDSGPEDWKATVERTPGGAYKLTIKDDTYERWVRWVFPSKALVDERVRAVAALEIYPWEKADADAEA
jgi:hypothetical protein